MTFRGESLDVVPTENEERLPTSQTEEDSLHVTTCYSPEPPADCLVAMFGLIDQIYFRVSQLSWRQPESWTCFLA